MREPASTSSAQNRRAKPIVCRTRAARLSRESASKATPADPAGPGPPAGPSNSTAGLLQLCSFSRPQARIFHHARVCPNSEGDAGGSRRPEGPVRRFRKFAVTREGRRRLGRARGTGRSAAGAVGSATREQQVGANPSSRVAVIISLRLR